VITVNPSALKLTKPREYAVRFVFGGACTAIAGWIAHRYGPAVGGLFLAFPAIFPASACLIESHERERKAEAGIDGTSRGRAAASLDAAGASAGAIALAAFAAVVWLMIGQHEAVLVIGAATLVWAAFAVVIWLLRKSRLLHWRHARAHQPRL